MNLRVVFDTNTVISALVFSTGDLVWLRDHWKNRYILVLVSKDTAEELIRVLAYPKFKLAKEEIEILLSDYLPFTEIVAIPDPGFSHPKCRAAQDQKFIDLATTGEADIIVSGDQDILTLTVPGVAIETIAKYRTRIKKTLTY